MDPFGGQWERSSSGSGAPWNDAQHNDIFMSVWARDGEPSLNNEAPNEDEYNSLISTSVTYGTADLPHGASMSPKVPPSYDGRNSWFAFEELVNDWCDSATLDTDKRGPALKNRLSGDAAVYKPMLDREKLKTDEGVEYFLSTLRPNFVKGVQNVFLYRLVQFNKLQRGHLEITRWVPKFVLQRKRLTDSWMDLFTPVTSSHPEFAVYLQALVDRYTANGWQMPADEDSVLALINDQLKNRHLEKFPYNDNLMALIFIISSNLSEQQRTLLQTHCTLRNWRIQDYSFDAMRTLFMELLTAPKSSLEDPNIRPRNDFRGGHRSFVVLDDVGELDGHSGYWVEDEETGIEGFVDEIEDVFWVFNDQESSWASARFKGRSYSRGGKGKRKGKKGFGKGGKGRRFFKPRRFGKGRSHMADELSPEYSADAVADAFKGGKKGKSKGKGKKGFSKGFGHFGKGKGKKGKGKGKPDAAADAAQPQVENPYLGSDQQWTPEEWQAYENDWSQDDYTAWSTTDSWWENDAFASSDWHDDAWYAAGEKTFYVEHRYETISEQPFKAYASIMNSPEYAKALSGKSEWELAKERWQVMRRSKKPIDLSNNPGHVILDLGCTKAMGSMRAVVAFIEYAWYFGIWAEWLPCNTIMSFANSQCVTLKWCVRIHFPTNPPVSTVVDVHEDGNIPILFSLPQMMNLGFKLDLSETECYLTCSAFGYNRVPLEMSTSRHLVLDLCTIKRNLTQTGLTHSFATEVKKENESTCLSVVPLEASENQETFGARLQGKTPRDDPRAKAYPRPVPDASLRREGEQIARDLDESMRPEPKAKAKAKAKGKAKPRVRGDPEAPLPGIGERGGPGPDGPQRRRREPRIRPLQVPEDLDISEPLVEVPGEEPSEEDKVKKVLRKIHDRLRDNGELLKIHLKHYHMTTENFKRRTTQLKIPKEIYEQYEQIVKSCESCQRWKQAPTRSRVSGMRAVNFGDLIFVDHVDISVDEHVYCVLVVLDAASNLIWAGAQNSKLHTESMRVMQTNWDEWNVRPKAVVGDNYFMEPDFRKWYDYHGIKPIELGANTPWPNRAEAAVKLFKHYSQILIDSVRHYAETNPGMKNITVRAMLHRACWARNNAVTYGGKTPLEIATGRRPPDVIDLENMMPKQLASEPSLDQQCDNQLRELAQKAHLEARQREDLRRDLAQRLRSSDGPFTAGEGVWYWDRDASKIRGGEWVKARVIKQGKPPMVTLDLAGQTVQVNQSKIRKNPDPWHDVVVPGVDGRDDYCTVPDSPPVVVRRRRTGKQPEHSPPPLVQDAGEREPSPEYSPLDGSPPPTPDINGESDYITSLSLFAVSEEFTPCMWLQGDSWAAESLVTSKQGVIKKGFWFKQYCNANDKLSAVIGQNSRTGTPVFLDDKFRPAEELADLQKFRPRMVWISADERNRTAMFCRDAAEVQMRCKNKFVIAIPWRSSLWSNSKVMALLAMPGVSTTTVDLNTYTPVPASWSSALCLVHNLPSLDCLSKGSYVHSAKYSGWKTVNDYERFSDDYPISFCQNVYIGLIEQERPREDSEWPMQNPVQGYLSLDLLDELNQRDLRTLDKAFTTECQPGILPEEQAQDIAEVLSAEPHMAVNAKVKSLITWLNSRPQGTIVDMSSKTNQFYYPRAMDGLVALRKTYFPMASFQCCRVYRGVLDDLPSTVAGKPDNAVIFLWRKDGKVKRIFASQIHGMRFGNFNAKPWSIVVMYDVDGTVGNKTGSSSYSPGSGIPRSVYDAPGDDDDNKPPDMPVDDEDMPEPFRHPPPPDYSNPDMPVPSLRQQSEQPEGVYPKRERSRSRENRPDPYRYPTPPPEEDDEEKEPDLVDDSDDELHYEGQTPGYRPKRERSRSRDDPQGPSLRERSRSRDDDQQTSRRRPERDARSEPARYRIHTPDVRPVIREPKSEPRPSQSSSSSSTGPRHTAVKSMPRPGAGCNIPRPAVKEEPKTEDASEEEDLFCMACATLQMRGDERCRACDPDNKLDAKPKGYTRYATHWCAATYQNDLHIMDDDCSWRHTPDAYKLAAMTQSFSFVEDENQHILDISSMESNPDTSKALYLDNSWHRYAELEEICADVEHESLHVRQEVFRAVKNAMPKRKAARSEANAQQKREYAKQFLQAKLDEYKSWKENDVFEIIDMRKEKVANFVTGRWVLTIKHDKDGKFLKCKARWVLRGFQDSQIWNLQTDSPTSTRPGFRLQCQAAANNQWDLTHIDLKTAFLQGDEYDGKRDVVCQLPPEANLPDYMGARLKRAAYGLNDAPRLWFNRLDKHLRSYGLVPTRADRCCYVLYSDSKPTKGVHFSEFYEEKADDTTSLSYAAWNSNLGGDLSQSALHSLSRPAEANDKSRPLDIDGALELLLDPISGSKARNKVVEGIVTIHVDDCFMCGTNKFMEAVVARLRKDFQVGSEDKNDIMFVGQRIRWINQGQKNGYIQVDQEKKVEELSEVSLDASLRDEQPCTPDYHKQFRSVLGQINWLQSRTQWQSCYLFSRCASACAGPKYGDLRALNKLVRKIRAEVVRLNFWTLFGLCRIVGYPDAAYRNNADKSSQRGQTIFICEPRKEGMVNPRGSLVDYESQKIKRTVLSTTVSELYAFMKCYGTCQFLRGLWMDMTGTIAQVHMRTDANNLVTTASTTHLPEQKETIHMINQLRTEALSGQIDDLAHVISVDCLADCLTKASADMKYLLKAVNIGFLPNVDKHPPFRDLMKGRHKAYESVAHWVCENLECAPEVTYFLGTPVGTEIQKCLAVKDWYDAKD